MSNSNLSERSTAPAPAAPVVQAPSFDGVPRVRVKRHTFAYNRRRFLQVAGGFLQPARTANHVEVARTRLFERASRFQLDSRQNAEELYKGQNQTRIRDCARAMKTMLEPRSADLAGFDVAQALYDLAQGRPRPDLRPGFYADIMHTVLGLMGRGPGTAPGMDTKSADVSGRRAARLRSAHLDRLWSRVEREMGRYRHGMEEDAVVRRRNRRDHILSVLGGSESDWEDPSWQIANVIRDADRLGRLVSLSESERQAVSDARRGRLPFGITPYYLSLFDAEPSERDRAVRAQVLPPPDYVRKMRHEKETGCAGHDFMLEADTSPIDLITRRYPGIAIFKPYNTCPQICVYCQRNWEITDVLAADALASDLKIDAALDWLRRHPSIREVLFTGGDPFTLGEPQLKRILDGIASIPSVERIRIGTRTLVTMPMRITSSLVRLLQSYRVPGRREVAIVTHVEHPYEVTPALSTSAHRLRAAGLPVYNQLVYTFFVSRRFEATLLRRLLRLAGIDPYYTFATKGKEETAAYRVPLARLLQEVQEEARLLPGLARTDEPVFNVPGLGKNHVRAVQHRDLIAVRPNGARVYEFHPWEKNIVKQDKYVGDDVPILGYLERLRRLGEKPSDYETIWYYF